MQAGGLLAYRSKFCWLEVICCACQSNELKREIMKKNLGAKNLGGAWSNRPPPLESPLLFHANFAGCQFSIATSTEENT